MNYGDICTVVENMVGQNILVRSGGNHFPIDRNAIRKATMSEFVNFDSQQLVHPYFINGIPYMLSADTHIQGLDTGDVGCIVGVEIKENEEDDLFLLDFGMTKYGHRKIKLDKKFIDNHMSYYDLDFENLYGEEQVEIKPTSQKDNEPKQQEKEFNEIKVGDYVFVVEGGYVFTNPINLHKTEIDGYISALQEISGFLKKPKNT